MTTHAQGPPDPKHKHGGFFQITHEQLALPKREHASQRPPGTSAVTKLEWLVLCALESLSWGGKKKCLATNLQIADAVGLSGGVHARRSQVRIALHGRTYRKGRWDTETGKWKRDGERITIPGLCDPSRGFVEVVQADPLEPRELALTSRWLKCGRYQVFNGDGGEASETGLGDGPAVAEVSTVPHADDGHAAPLRPLAPVVTEAAETGTFPVIADQTIGDPTTGAAPSPIDRPSPGSPETAGKVSDPPTADSIVEPAAAPAEQPSPEILAEVLGTNFVHRSRADQAAKFVQVMFRRTIPLAVIEGDRIRPTIGAGASPLSPQEKAVLIGLKPELVELLKAGAEKAKPPPKAGEPPGGERAAPRVVNPAEIRAMIGKLTGRPATDDSDCRAIARRLVTDPGFAYHDDEPATSEATYFGIALDTKCGRLPQDVITGAFEAACRAKVRNRGAAFIAGVKRIKAGLRKPDHEGGPAS